MHLLLAPTTAAAHAWLVKHKINEYPAFRYDNGGIVFHKGHGWKIITSEKDLFGTMCTQGDIVFTLAYYEPKLLTIARECFSLVGKPLIINGDTIEV